ncbi:unnamed protein product [Symbiodinium sp. CCMP2592]|nr:unnamed protein product [Symbiodinium sp. CCMP2592]
MYSTADHSANNVSSKPKPQPHDHSEKTTADPSQAAGSKEEAKTYEYKGGGPVKLSPGVTQFERRLASPLQGLMNAYRAAFSKFAKEPLVPRWKTLALVDSKEAWLGRIVYRRGTLTDWECEIHIPEEHAEKLLETWRRIWYDQLRQQVNQTTVEQEAFDSAARLTAHNYAEAKRLSRFLTKAIPEYNEGKDDGLDHWIARFRYEFPWPVKFVHVPQDAEERTHFTGLRSREELMEQMAAQEQEAAFTVDSASGGVGAMIDVVSQVKRTHSDARPSYYPFGSQVELEGAVEEAKIAHINNDSHPLSEEHRIALANILHETMAPSTDRDQFLKVSEGQPFRLTALQYLAQAMQDKEAQLPLILDEGVPTGAFGALPSSGQWPPTQGSLDFAEEFSPASLEHCRGNWFLAESNPALLQELVEEEGSALQALEESLARAWVNQTGHHQRLSWLEGIIQSLRAMNTFSASILQQLAGVTREQLDGALPPAQATVGPPELPFAPVPDLGDACPANPSPASASADNWGFVGFTGDFEGFTDDLAVPVSEVEVQQQTHEFPPSPPVGFNPNHFEAHLASLCEPDEQAPSLSLLGSGDENTAWYEDVRAMSESHFSLVPSASKRDFGEEVRPGRIARAVGDERSRTAVASPALPWERGVFRAIFGDDGLTNPFDNLVLKMPGPLVPAHVPPAEPKIPEPPIPSADIASRAFKSFKDVHPSDERDMVMDRAVCKLQHIICRTDVDDIVLAFLLLVGRVQLVRAEGNIEEARGEVARTILNFNGRLESVEDSLEEGLENQAGLLRKSDFVMKTFSSFMFKGATLEERHTKVRLALGGKAPRTLQKRYGQSAKLVSWAELESVKAFPIDGQIAEEFLRHLVSSSGRHSVLTGAVECFAFLHHVLGVDMELNACSNPIVQGILRKARLERPAKKQARALLASEVLALEALLADECRPLIDRFCAGAFLFALYGRARLGDLRVLDCFITDLLEDSASGCGYLEVLSLSHKCRSTSNSQGMRMHIVVPAKGIGPRCWGKDFISVARELGRDLTSIASGEPLLYMPDAHGNFSNVPADTDRFAAWVQDLLSTVPAYSGDKISGHSAKATPLSWMGKAGTDFDTQTLLGHHVLVGRSSALTYARDTQAAPVRKFEALIGDVRRGVFLPDSTRSGRFAPEEPADSDPPLDGVLFSARDMSSAFPTPDEGGPEPVFAFPPSPPPQLDDSLTPFPMPGFLDQAGQDPEGEADADWLGERDWYAEAAAEEQAQQQEDEPDLETGAEGCDAEPGGSESSSSSESSTSESVDERVQASGERAGELEHRKLNEQLGDAMNQGVTSRSCKGTAWCLFVAWDDFPAWQECKNRCMGKMLFALRDVRIDRERLDATCGIPRSAACVIATAELGARLVWCGRLLQILAMATLLKSEAAFDERARECGLPDEELGRLKTAGIKTISLLAFSTSAPGVQPSEEQLRSLLRPLAPESVSVGVVAAIRHLMFECQTLCLAHVKASVEGNEKRIELAPAERTTRILQQKAKMKGLTLVGQLECSYASYDYVGAMIEKDSPMYLEPHRFDTRAAEVARERPGKELILDHNRISVRDKADKYKCAIQDPLALSQALQRRALASDLMGACTYEAMHAWHSFLLDRMQQQAPPGWSRPSIEQVLRTDRAGWVRMSEQVKSLRRDSSGNLPLDDALGKLTSDPHVLFHLLPLKSSEVKPDKPDKPPKLPHGDPDKKRKPNSPNKQDSGNKVQKAELPDELKNITGLRMATEAGEKFCWPFNCKKGCKFAKADFSGQPVVFPPAAPMTSAAKRVKVCQTGEALEASLDALISHNHCAKRLTCKFMDSVLPLEPASSPPAETIHPAEVYAGQILKLARAPARSEVLHLFNLLPKDKPTRGEGTGCAFACGMYCQGPLLGLRANTKRFPLACSVLASFVKAISPDFQFSTINIFFNVKTSPHVDANNAPMPNLVAGLSNFQDGQVLVESSGGPRVIETSSGKLPAVALEVANTHAIFDAYRLRHATAAWQGDRVVLVAFSVRNACMLSPCDLSTLQEQGFAPNLDAVCSTDTPPVVVPPISSKCLPAGAEQRLQGHSLQSMLFLQIFCGAGHLAAAVKRKGIGQCLGVASRVTGATRCPVLPLDLKNEEQHELLWDVLNRGNVCGVHISPPASDAQLCELSARILKWCHGRGILVSVENPAASSAWQGPLGKTCLALGLLKTSLHQCMFGDPCAKHSTFFHNYPELRRLGIACDDSHSHAPWQSGALHVYPPDLCDGFARALLERLKAFGCAPSTVTDVSMHRAAQVAAAKQPKGKRIPPIVPPVAGTVVLRGPGAVMPPTGVLKSFTPLSSELVVLPPMHGLPAGSKCLRSVLFGGGADLPSIREMTFSVPKSCEDFVQQACFAEHPKHLYSGIPDVLAKCVSKCASESYESLGRERTASLRRWVARAKELSEQVDPDPPVGHCAEVLKGKDLRLFKEMLDESGHVDSGLPSQVKRGFDIMGPLPASGAMPKKNTFATLTPKEVRDNASSINKAILGACRSSKDKQVAEEVFALTCDEKERGWLDGPHDFPLPDGAVLTRRFGIRQTSTQADGSVLDKTRPIDDYTESQVNLTNASVETISPHGVDTIVAGICRRITSRPEQAEPEELVACTVDLRKAYKQLPVSLESLNDCRLLFADNQVFGRRARQVFSVLSKACSCKKNVKITGELLHALLFFRDHIVNGEPRRVSACKREKLTLFTDASFGSEGSGLGGILYDSAAKPLKWFAEWIDPCDLVPFGSDAKEGLIYELEIFAAVQGVVDLLKGKSNIDLVLFVDNESALSCLISGRAEGIAACILQKLVCFEEENDINIWCEWVPSQSNPADGPSRPLGVGSLCNLNRPCETNTSTLGLALRASRPLTGRWMDPAAEPAAEPDSEADSTVSTVSAISRHLADLQRDHWALQEQFRAAQQDTQVLSDRCEYLEGRIRVLESFENRIRALESARDYTNHRVVWLERIVQRARAASLAHYARWRASVGLDPAVFPLDEAEAYLYVCFLRSEGAPRSRAPRFREAINFAGAMLGADVSDASSSARIQGAANPQVQAVVVRKKVPLTVAQVRALEEFVLNSDNDLAAVLAGYALYCLHGRLRWSDAQHTEAEPTLDVHEGKGFLNAQLYHHKTANRGSLARHRLLPVSCISPGLAEGSWAEAWLERRRRLGLKASRGVPMMPRPLCTGGFDSLPLDPSLGALWLREVLKECQPLDLDVKWGDIATHSLKATLLSYMAKAGAPENLRAIAGYHLRSANSSTLEYSRDTLAPALHFLECMFLTITSGLFAPDATRAGRWTQGVRSVDDAIRFLLGKPAPSQAAGPGPAEAAGADEAVQSDPESPAESIGSAGEAEEAGVSIFALGSDLQVSDDARRSVRCFQHKLSGVIHAARDDQPPDEGEMTVFRCGRFANRNYELLDEVPTIMLHKCSSCWGAKDLRQ